MNDALRELLERVQAVLGAHFVGMYLTGSLALGDFDPHTSDIDFVVVTGGTLSDDLVGALRDLHARFDTGGSPWAGKVEAVIFPREALRPAAPDQRPDPQVEKGRILFVDQLESGWVFQCYILREHGVTLAGPEPRTLIDPLDPDEMRRAVVPIAVIWLGLAHLDPAWLAWLRERENQAFVALTLCRLLYTLDTGAVASKPAAVRWAQQAVGGRWAASWRGPWPGNTTARRYRIATSPARSPLIAYTVGRFRQWEAGHPAPGSASIALPAGEEQLGRPDPRPD